MQSTFNDLIQKRRSIYGLGKDVEASNEEITALVKDIILHTPSAFNNQTTRAVVLFEGSHDKLWEIVWDHVKSANPNATEEDVENTRQKIASFQAAYGTILFFEDQEIVREYEEQFALYAENFQPWSEQANGAATMNVWTALAEQGIGASLQHYNPLIDEDVRQTWDLPETWKLRSQMPFGSIEAAPGDKDSYPIDARVLAFN